MSLKKCPLTALGVVCVFSTIARILMRGLREAGVCLEVFHLCRGLDLRLSLEKVLALFPLLNVDLRMQARAQ
jgi:hypothetical protein